MISDPLKYADDFADAGADLITFHVECDSDIDKTIGFIHIFDGIADDISHHSSKLFRVRNNQHVLIHIIVIGQPDSFGF